MSDRDFSNATSHLDRAASALRPQPQQHVRTIADQLELIAKGDFASVFSNSHDDVTLEIFAPPEFPFIRRADGAAALQAAILHNFDSVEDQRPTIGEVFAEGDTVILFGTETGKVRPSGLLYHVEFVERFTFREGRLAALRIIAAHCGGK